MGVTLSTGRIEISAALRPITDSEAVNEWLRFQATASITTTRVALVMSSGRSAMK
ncbi:hypothetical protein D3C84_1240810 [compost metagenome]